MFRQISEMRAVARRLGVSRRLLFFLFTFSLVSIAFEAIGIGILLPVFELLRAGGTVDPAQLPGRHWDLMRHIADHLGVRLSLGLLLGVSFALICLRQLVSFFDTRYFGFAQRRLLNQIRQRAFIGFLRSDTALQDQARIGEIAGNLTVELDRTLSSIFASVRALSTGVQISIYLGGLFLLSIPVTLLSLVVIAIAAYFTRGLLRKIKQTGASITDANLQLTSFMVERLKHARLIRLSGTQKAEAAAFSKLSTWHSEQSMRQALVAKQLMLLPEPVAIGFSYIVLFIGGQVFGLSIERLGLFLIVFVRLMPMVREVIGYYNSIFGKWPSARRVDRLLRSFAEAREPRGGDRAFDSLDQCIRYERVTFGYAAAGTPALMNVTVTIPAHRMIAIIGPSGAGKSTFVDLLPRLRNPPEGRILFDGIPIDEFSVASVRNGIAFVPQQPQIFNITAAEHIRFGKEDATDDEVREAARLAGALQFIESFSNGFDTLLQDGGRSEERRGGKEWR